MSIEVTPASGAKAPLEIGSNQGGLKLILGIGVFGLALFKVFEPGHSPLATGLYAIILGVTVLWTLSSRNAVARIDPELGVLVYLSPNFLSRQETIPLQAIETAAVLHTKGDEAPDTFSIRLHMRSGYPKELNISSIYEGPIQNWALVLNGCVAAEHEMVGATIVSPNATAPPGKKGRRWGNIPSAPASGSGSPPVFGKRRTNGD